jgi:hypothetical protein
MKNTIIVSLHIKPAGSLKVKRIIEFAGRHIDGINDVFMDISSHRIYVTCELDKKEALYQLKKFIHKIGYGCILQDKESRETV